MMVTAMKARGDQLMALGIDEQREECHVEDDGLD